MSNVQLVIWEEFATDYRKMRLQDGERYVEGQITREEALDVDRHEWLRLVEDKLQKLCEEWNRKYGGRALKVVPPQAEAEPWTVVEDDVIDGELVVHELPGPDATHRGHTSSSGVLRALPSTAATHPTSPQGEPHA